MHNPEKIPEYYDHVFGQRSLAWGFVEFCGLGGCHGFYQIIEDAAEKHWVSFRKKRQDSFSYKLFLKLRTFLLVDIAWVFFRADSLAAAGTILRKSLKMSNLGILLNGQLFALGLDATGVLLLTMALFVLAADSIMKECGIDTISWLGHQEIWFRYLIYWLLVTMIVLSMNLTGQEFIYFQF